MNVRQTLKEAGCIYSGHFVGASNEHLAGYCNIDPLLPNVKLVKELSAQLVEDFRDDGVETVAAPAIGAIPFSHWGANRLMELNGGDIFGVWADRVPGAATREFVFEREGFVEAVMGRRVLILEDIINKMTSVRAMIKTVRQVGGLVVGVGSVAANRGASATELDVPKFVNLCDIEYDTWPAEDCARSGLCVKNEPIVTDIGHGDDFQAAYPDYKGGYVKLLGN